MLTGTQRDDFCTVIDLKLEGLSPPELWVLSGSVPLADAVKSQQTLHLDRQVNHSSNAACFHIGIGIGLDEVWTELDIMPGSDLQNM